MVAMRGRKTDEVSELSVGIGQMRIARAPDRLVTIGLGSCVAIVLYDAVAQLGGLAHVVLPREAEAHDYLILTKFADAVIDLMMEGMRQQGADTRRLQAKIFGGGNMFPTLIAVGSPMDIGRRNVEAVREELERLGMRVVGEAVGGQSGRTVVFDTSDGSVLVKTIGQPVRMY